jgi:hypothetical protein
MMDIKGLEAVGSMTFPSPPLFLPPWVTQQEVPFQMMTLENWTSW